MHQTSIIRFIMFVMLLLGLVACDDQPSSQSAVFEQSPATQAVARPSNAIEISIIYAPESDLYMPQTITEFNSAYARGVNPLTNQPLGSGELPIYVVGVAGSSGTVMEGIVNAILSPNNQNVARPTIFAPSVSHWLALANYFAGRDLFNLAEARPTALAPVVMAIWKSRLDAIRNTVASRTGQNPEDVQIGWEELLDVLASPNGWQDYGIPNGRRTVYYGHTDPYISSTALSTLIAEFYAAARDNGFTGRRLTLSEVNDADIQQGVRNIEQLIRHYSRRTTEFKEYIAQGPEYLDFVALEENDLLFINMGLTETSPPEQLVALYPKEGTFWHEHPFGIVNASWVSPEQTEAAQIFTEFVLTPAIQERIMSQGFRPANPDVPLAYPFVAENGIDINQPSTVLDVPAPEVVAAIQQSWAFVKKQADIWLVIDVSGSMANERKLEQAKTAALAFIEGLEINSRVGLAVFSESVEILVEMGDLERNANALREEIAALQPLAGTELFKATQAIVSLMNTSDDTDRIRAVILLSDGEDTGDRTVTLNDVVNTITASRGALNPIILIPVAYGESADVTTLSRMARASNTRVQSGDPNDIQALLELISSYF
ncbi:MAG: VWA domain-containing protein [Phototrophicales bacterium]|nr:VWA domain-containing protein [Phototrophicales bacterium]